MFASHLLNSRPWKLTKVVNPWSKKSKPIKTQKTPQFVELPLGYPKDFVTKDARKQTSQIKRTQTKKVPVIRQEEIPEEIQEAREVITKFFIEHSKTASISSLLEQFDLFFINHVPDKVPQLLNHSIYQLLVFNRRSDFVYLLNRCAFLIVATGLKQKKMSHIKQLIALFKNQPELPSNASLATRQFREWGNSYQTTRQFKLLEMFVPHVVSAERSWSERYLRFTLLANTLRDEISREERYACAFLYQILKSRYKFQLVMYITKGYEAPKSDPASINPTLLSASTLTLIKKIVLKKGQSYVTTTDEFLGSTEKKSFVEFKAALVDYVFAPMAGDRRLKWLPEKLEQYLMTLNPEKDNVAVRDHLIKKTCNDLISYLLNPESFADPTHPFTLLMIQREFLSLSLMLLKLVLISPQSYGHVMLCMNELISHYSDKPETDCQWLIGLLETVQVIMTLAIDERKTGALAAAV